MKWYDYLWIPFIWLTNAMERSLDRIEKAGHK